MPSKKKKVGVHGLIKNSQKKLPIKQINPNANSSLFSRVIGR